MAADFGAGDQDDLADSFIQVEPSFLRWRLLGQSTNSSDDSAGSLTMCDNSGGAGPGLLQVLSRHPAYAGAGIGNQCSQRLVDFVRNRRTQFAQSGHPRHMRQFCLCFLQRFLGVFAFVFDPLLFAQVDYESGTLISTSFKNRSANQYGYTTAVFAEILFAERLGDPNRSQIGRSPFVPLPPLRRRQLFAAKAIRGKLLATVLHHLKKSVVRLKNLALGIP